MEDDELKKVKEYGEYTEKVWWLASEMRSKAME